MNRELGFAALMPAQLVSVSMPSPGTVDHSVAECSLLEKIAGRVPGIIFKFKLMPDGRSCFPYMSAAVTRMYNGITPEQLELDATPFFAFRHPDDAQALVASVLRSAQTLSPWDHEYRLILPEVGVVWRHGNGLPERQPDGSVAWFGFITDITERKRTENQLRVASVVFESSGEAMAVVDPQGRMQAVNQAMVTLTGFSRQALQSAPLSTVVGGLTPDLALTDVLAEMGSHWQGACLGWRSDGRSFAAWLRLKSADWVEIGSQAAVLIATLSDRSPLPLSSSHSANGSGLDPLTALVSRRLMVERTRCAIEFASAMRHPMALIYIDLDYFMEVNNMFGHQVGDQLLQEVAQRLKACAGKTDTVARMGGDEFAVLLQRKGAVTAAEEMVKQFVSLLSEPFYLGGEEIFVTASIGIVEYPKDAQDVNDLLVCADRSVYQAKEEGRNKVQHFDDQMLAKARRRRRISDALRVALPQQQFSLVYQPIVDLQTRKVVKAEALIRWQCPKLPGVGPAEFIPVAEDLGLIQEIGEWVFQQVALMARDINMQLAEPIQISINKSARQLTAGDSSALWLERLASLNVPAHWIGVEITETLLLDGRPSVQNALWRLRQGGVQLSLDDFGTGYSAMSYLLRFELDYIKIDQSFIRDVVRPRGRAIVEAIVVMAHKLGLRVIAEGVEDQRVLSILQEMGCDYVQGYYFSPPLAQADFLSWVKRESVWIG